MTNPVGTVTSQYKTDLYTKWIQYVMKPLDQRVKFQGRLSSYIAQQCDLHQRISEVLKNELECAEQSRVRALENDPEYSKCISVIAYGGIGGMFGGLLMATLNAPVALFMGIFSGAVCGHFCAEKSLEIDAAVSNLPKFQKAFGREVEWIKSRALLFEVVDHKAHFCKKSVPTLSEYLRYIVEQNQLAALREHFDYICQQEHIISQMPIFDEKPPVSNLQVIKNNLKAGIDFSQSGYQIESNRKLQQQQQDSIINNHVTLARINISGAIALQQNYYAQVSRRYY